jgi:hypothetical protein
MMGGPMARYPRTNPRQAAGGAALLLVVLAVALFQYVTRTSNKPAPPAGGRAPSADVRIDTGAGFRSRQTLEEHFHKHGREFGPGVSIDDYLRRAQQLRDAPPAGAILELKRPDGVMCRYDRSTGDFIAFNSDRTIRTFFRPNDGEAYFRRQAQRAED